MGNLRHFLEIKYLRIFFPKSGKEYEKYSKIWRKKLMSKNCGLKNIRKIGENPIINKIYEFC